MNNNLNIRKLYNTILEKRAAANGTVILENVEIPRNNSSPDIISFEGKLHFHRNTNAFAFCFIGETSNVLLKTSGTHPPIFNSLRMLRHEPFDSDRIASNFNDFGVEPCGELREEDLNFFFTNQLNSAMGQTRIATRSGRIWKNIDSETAKQTVDVVAFWCSQKEVREDDLKKTKKCFGDGKDLFWVGTDSETFNYYGDTYNDTDQGEIKQLRSKIYPQLTHDDIVDILMRAHSGYNITPFEKKVVWEFRGFDPADIKQVTGGYPTRAEYEYNSRFSEDTKFDKLFNKIHNEILSEDVIKESGLSRIWEKTQKHTCGSITACRDHNTYKLDKTNNGKMVSYLQKLGYSVTSIQGTYIENFNEPNAKHVSEKSFFVCNDKIDGDDNGELEGDLFELGYAFSQDSVLIIPFEEEAYLLGTTTREGAYIPFKEKAVVGKGKYGKVAGEYLSNKGREFAFEDVQEPQTINGRRGRDMGFRAAEKMIHEAFDKL